MCNRKMAKVIKILINITVNSIGYFLQLADGVTTSQVITCNQHVNKFHLNFIEVAYLPIQLKLFHISGLAC